MNKEQFLDYLNKKVYSLDLPDTDFLTLLVDEVLEWAANGQEPFCRLIDTDFGYMEADERDVDVIEVYQHPDPRVAPEKLSDEELIACFGDTQMVLFGIRKVQNSIRKQFGVEDDE